MSDQFSVEVNGKRYEIDPMSITLGERRKYRTELAKLDGGGAGDGWDEVAGLIWLAARRDDPDITLEQIMDSVTVGSLEPAEVDTESPEA